MIWLMAASPLEVNLYYCRIWVVKLPYIVYNGYGQQNMDVGASREGKREER